jgi:hypothetical protein
LIRARHSLDRWSRYAHHILDRVQRGHDIKGEHIDWALSYLGDTNAGVKIPEDLMGGNRHPSNAPRARARFAGAGA